MNFKREGKYRVDELFYLLGKMIFLPFCLFGFWFAGGGFETCGDIFTCAIRDLCGLPCPGCGGTRAFYYLFRGDFLNSLRMNATVLYGVTAYLHFMLLMFYRKHIKKTVGEEKEVQIQYYMYGAVIVILVQWLIKIINIIHYVMS